MRRHSKATSSRSNETQAKQPRDSASAGRLRLTILLATAAAFLLVPVAQAAAEGTLKVSGAGNGAGEVSSVGGFEGSGSLEGTPPIECSYISPGPATGVCEDEMTEAEPGFSGVFLHANPAPGSEFVGWEVEEGSGLNYCGEEFVEEKKCFIAAFEGGNAAITAFFEKEATSGPTNKRLLTLTKSPSPSSGTGQGTVKSKPKGINCASACSGAIASLYKETTVVITEKPATGSTFTEWNGCDSETEGKCIVTMSEAKAVEAVFAGTSKAIPNPQELTLTKAGTGIGTVKSKPGGIACETECTTTSALFAGELTEPKPKAATKVILTVTPVAGSSFDGWSGACSGEALTCEVEMSEAKEAIAEFTALPKNTLTVLKSPSPSAGTGQGTVKSKPKGINCASACSEEEASFSEDTTVVLTAKAATGSTFAGWSGGGCSGTGTCEVTMSSAKAVTATFSGTSKAIGNPQALTLAKAGSGYGTVKSKPGGIACEALCTSTTALYQGTLTEPKPKAAATVILTATSAPGSKAVEWSGCDSEPTPSECVVSMSAAKSVTATFDELE